MHYRTAETYAKYKAYHDQADKDDSCLFCTKEPLKENYSFKYWKVLPNDFPYDAVADVHDMIVPKRHFASDFEMTPEERAEFLEIKKDILPVWGKYDSMLENFIRNRNVHHYHIHLLKYKTDPENGGVPVNE